MAVEIAGKMKPKNNNTFAIVDAQDIEVDVVDKDGNQEKKRLPEVLDGKLNTVTPTAKEVYVVQRFKKNNDETVEISTIGISSSQTRIANRIPTYGTGGNLLVADTPADDYSATSKKYVNDNFSKKLYEHTVELDITYYKRPVDSGIIYHFKPVIKIITTDSSLGYEAIGSSFTMGDLSRLLIAYFKKNENDSRALVPALNPSTGLYDYGFETGIGEGYNVTVSGVVDENGDKISLYIESDETMTAYFYVKEL